MAELVLQRGRQNRRRRGYQAPWRRTALAALDKWLGWTGVLAALTVLAMALAYAFSLIHVRSEVVLLGRRISALNEQVRAAQIDLEEARLRQQELVNPRRLEELAPQFKLAAPRPDQVVIGETR
jgi:cell division protein FtsL